MRSRWTPRAHLSSGDWILLIRDGGIGKRLLDECMEGLRRAGLKRVIIMVADDNQGGRGILGSGAAGKRSPGPSRWELIFSGRKRVASKHSIFRDRSRHNRRLQLFSVEERACVDGDFRERNSCASWLMNLWTRNKIQPLPAATFLGATVAGGAALWREDRTQSWSHLFDNHEHGHESYLAIGRRFLPSIGSALARCG